LPYPGEISNIYDLGVKMKYQIHILHREEDGTLVFEHTLSLSNDYFDSVIYDAHMWVRETFRQRNRNTDTEMLDSDYIDVLFVTKEGLGHVEEVVRYNTSELRADAKK
jgi:hypothetical protein